MSSFREEAASSAQDRQFWNATESWNDDAKRFASAFRYASIGMALVSPQGHFLEVNRAMCDLTGYDATEIIGLDFQSITHFDDLNSDLGYVEQLLSGEIESYQLEKRYWHKNGDCIWVLLSVSVITDSKNQALYFISQLQDITTRKLFEFELQTRESEIKALVENASDVIARYDQQFRVLYINPAIERVSGRCPAEFIGKTLSEAGAERDFAQIFEANLQKVFDTGQEHQYDYASIDGLSFRHASLIPECDASGAIASVLVISRDITDIIRTQKDLEETQRHLELSNLELEKANNELKRLAHHDSLTGLKNRRAFDERFHEEIARSRRTGTVFSLVLLDVDHFKAVNDTYGHAIGDQVLSTIGEILLEVLRAADIVVRYGGEEFALILPDTDIEGSFRAAERCRHAIEIYPWVKAPITVSCGIATWENEDEQTLLVRADLMLYAAKKAGRNRTQHANLESQTESGL